MAASPTEVSTVRTKTATPDWYSWGIFRPFPRSHICRKKKKKEFQPSGPWGPSRRPHRWPPSPFPTPPSRQRQKRRLRSGRKRFQTEQKNGLRGDTPDHCLPKSHELGKRVTARLLTRGTDTQSVSKSGDSAHYFLDTATRSVRQRTGPVLERILWISNSTAQFCFDCDPTN